MSREMRTWKTRQLNKIEVKVKIMSEAGNATQGRITQKDHWTGSGETVQSSVEEGGSLEKAREDLGEGGA